MKEKYSYFLLLVGIAIAAYFVIINTGSMLLGDSWLGSLLNLGLTPLAFIVSGFFILNAFLILVLDIKRFGKFLQYIGVVSLTFLYLINPIDIPTPIDDAIVGVIGTLWSIRLLKQSR
jgi:hypothetical protein